MAEMLEGVQILLDRMKMFPEEFVSDSYGGSHKWAKIFENPAMWNVLTKEEQDAIHKGMHEAARTVFSQRVAAHVLYLNNAVLEPQPKERTVRPTPKPPTFTTTNNIHLPDPATVTPGDKVRVMFKNGEQVTLYPYEYNYLLKQDPKRQESYLEWIAKGRP